MAGMLVLRTYTPPPKKRTLDDLDEKSGTGADLWPTRIFKRCGAVLAPALSKLAQGIVSTGVWPSIWCVPWNPPLYENKLDYEPGNNRGNQLITQMSKVLVRFLGLLFITY